MFIGAFLLAVCAYTAQASVTGYLGPIDLQQRVLPALTTSFTNLTAGDVASVYYGAKGFNLLETPLVEVLVLRSCHHVKDNFKDGGAPEQAFFALSTWALLACPEKAKLHTDATVKALKAVLENDKSSIADIHYALETLKVLKENAPNPPKVAQNLQARLKEDDSLLSLGHVLHSAALLGNAGHFALQLVEDVVVQADEVDGRMLQWEGGLTTTGMLLSGLLRIPGSKPFTQTQADKFATYLLNRKTVQNPKGILALLEAIVALSASSVSPVSITFVDSAQVTTEKPELKVRISDLLGKPIKPAPSPVVAQSATRVADDVVVLSKQPLTPGKEPTEFVLPLNLEPGQYRVGLTAGTHSSALTVRVLGPVTLHYLEVGVGDADGSSAPRLTKLHHPAKLTSTLQADSSQHLIARFSLSRAVHQPFLRLSSGKREIIFVAEKDSSKLYKIEVDVAAELAYSATFDIELILGDSIMSNPLKWTIGSLEVRLGSGEVPTPTSRGPRPEIKHMFRPAESRPPQVVSMLFTGLAASPLLLLLLLWAKVGVNFGNFSLNAVPFHVGLGGIFGLFALFWLQLDMFTTCAWLLPVGGFTFLGGHRILSQLASQRKQ